MNLDEVVFNPQKTSTEIELGQGDIQGIYMLGYVWYTLDMGVGNQTSTVFGASSILLGQM